MAIVKLTLSGQIQEQLQVKLLDGTYQVGEYLPGEITLAEELGVSRTTIRDAIGGLVEKGFLERQQGKGVLVINKTKNVAADSVRNMILRGNYTVAEFMETREMIDNHIVQFAAIRVTDEEIKNMWKSIEKMQSYVDNLEKYVQCDLEFHKELAKASKNHLLVALYSAIEPMLMQIISKVVNTTGAVERNSKYHTQILENIIKGDVDEAIKKMKEHNKASEQMFKESIKNNESLDSIIIMDF